MLDDEPEPMGRAAFPARAEGQPDPYERVGGMPVRMMTGPRNGGDDLVVDRLALLRTHRRGSGETLPGQARPPHAGVECGPRDPAGLMAAEPRLGAGILSAATRDLDAFALRLSRTDICAGVTVPARPRLGADEPGMAG